MEPARCGRCGAEVDTLHAEGEDILCGACIRELTIDHVPADLRPIKIRAERARRFRESGPLSMIRRSHSPCCGGQADGCRDVMPARPRLHRGDGAYNRIGVYYHPGLATWVAHLGDAPSPLLESHQPSPIAAIRHLLVDIERGGITFDHEWSPV